MGDLEKNQRIAEKLRLEQKRARRKALVLGMISILVFLTIWQLLCTFHIVRDNALVSPFGSSTGNLCKNHGHPSRRQYPAGKYLEQL